ncbi:MAG: hypothetical protein LBF50_08980 [Azoarcus sp.]|nr:hypothetical protein [Azoarcus sp.]
MAVYNSFDLLLLFQKREFRPFWFETGTPTRHCESLSRLVIARSASTLISLRGARTGVLFLPPLLQDADGRF